MKFISYFPLVMLIGMGAESADRVNSKESLRVCKDALVADMPGEMDIKFKRNTATSISKSGYKHWINFVEISDSEKTIKKFLCETSRSGEVLVQEIEDGHWKM